MKLLSESLLEFKKGMDPVRSLGIDRRSKILNDLDEAGIPHDKVKILSNGSIRAVNYPSWSDGFVKIQYKYLTPEELKMIDLLVALTFDSDKFKKSLIILFKSNKIDYDDVVSLIETYGTNSRKQEARTLVKIIHSRISRNSEERKHDKEYNTYAFIGYEDKEPVTVNGKKYYEDKFKVESIMKIDKYDVGSLQMIAMMKTRVQHQQDKGQKVYLIDLPKDMMDEDRYIEIPEHLQDIFEKYKRRI